MRTGNNIFLKSFKTILLSVLLVLSWTSVQAAKAPRLKPFVMAYKTSGEIGAAVEDVKSKLTANGFEIAGSYTPYDSVTIIIVTNDALKQAAAKSKFGAYGAGQRISVSKVNDEIQVAYTNPVYMSHTYRMEEDLAGVASQLEAALGRQMEYGPKKGLKVKKLRKYHYKVFMPYFDDQISIAKHASYAEAVQKVEEGLAAGKYGATKVYRIDIPGKEETVFGVSLKMPEKGDEQMDEKFIMNEVDFKENKSAAHLPYDMVVSGNEVYMLSPKFRIAISFPDLSMMGKNSFMNIMGCPAAIEKTLAQTAGTKRD